MVYEVKKGDYYITTDASKIDATLVHQYLSTESYWAAGISKEIVEKSLLNSQCFGVFYKEQQIGFARLVTDKATFAYLADVFILPAHRGTGLSKWLMEIIHAHPELQTLRRWMLGTKDAHGLYEQFGWTRYTEEVSERFMQKHNPDVYKNTSTPSQQ